MPGAQPPRPATDPTDEVLRLLDGAESEAARYGREDLVTRLDQERSRLRNPASLVLVVGEFKKGKSSLINALLNARVCPSDADRATAVPTFVRYGPRAGARMIGADGTAGAPVALTDIESLATAARDAGTIRSLEVRLPRELLRGGLVLVDTPGVGGGLTAAHAAVTLRALTVADVVLFVSDAGQEYSGPELEFLRQAVDLCPTVLCALTKVDFYPHWRRILDLDRAHLRSAALDYPIIALSAPLRRYGVRAGDRELVAESGYPWLAAALRQAAAHTAGVGAGAAAAAGHSVLTQLVAQVSTEHEALTGERSQRQERLAEGRRRVEQLKAGGPRWQQLLTDRIGDLASDVDHDLAVRLRKVRKQAADRIGAEDPTRSWGDLQPWIYRRTNEELLDHLRMIRTQADEVADEVARQFGAAAWELGVTAQVEASGAAAHDAKLADLAADRSARLQVALFAARGASVGAMVTHAVAFVVGLTLPVTLPATALVAAVLARKSWRGAQQSQLRAMRAEAERAVNAYLDEVDVTARKDSRDAVRRLHRQLRDVFSQRITESYATAVQNLQALSQAAQEDQRTREERRRHAAAELGRLRGQADEAEALVNRLLRDPAS